MHKMPVEPLAQLLRIADRLAVHLSGAPYQGRSKRRNVALATSRVGIYGVAMDQVLCNEDPGSKEFGPKKIRVNALSPGVTETECAHAAGVMGTEFEKYLITNTPLGRFGQPDDIARVAVFLASDDAGWLTGEVIFAGGGHK